MRRSAGAVVLTVALWAGGVVAGYIVLSDPPWGDHSPTGIVAVRDAYTGAPVPGAKVLALPLSCGDGCVPMEMTAAGPVARQFVADGGGEVHAKLPGDRLTITVSQPDYDAVRSEVAWPTIRSTLVLRPQWVAGRITTAGKPIAEAKVFVQMPGRELAVATRTDTDGRYRLTGVPEGANLVVDAPGISPRPRPIDRRTVMDLALRPDIITGTVRDPQGAPVHGITVVAGRVSTQTDTAGTYTLNGVDDGALLIVKGVGWMPQQVKLGSNLMQNMTVHPFVAKGLYMQAGTAADPKRLGTILDQISKSELNTVVVDLKDNNGVVYYDTKIALAQEVGAVDPILEPAQLVQTLHDRGVYAIARIVVMEDPIAAVKRPDLAIKDTRTGQTWRTNRGQAWMNPTNPGVWNYVADIASEAAGFGFDEVQLDYVRFPSDGALSNTEYGANFGGGEIQRRETIRAGLATVHDRVLPTRALLGADVFGIIGWIKGDNGIGQQFEDIAASLDVICSMDYPSHFGRGFDGWDIPNNYPYEVIKKSITKREERVPGVVSKTRPWLQAFTYGPGKEYSTPEVYAQIQACNEAGTAGYLLWNAISEYPQAWLPPKR